MPKTAKAKRAERAEQPAPRQPDSGPSTYVGNFTLHVGPLTTTGKLINVRKADKTGKFVTMCPDCQTPKMATRYACTNPAHVLTLKDGTEVPVNYATDAVGKAKKLPDGSYAPVDAADVREAKESELEKDIMEVSVHPIDEVRNMTWAGDNAYVMIPRSANDRSYALLVKAIESGRYGFVSVCNLRNNEGFFRLDAWNGHIVIQKCVFPEDCNMVEKADATVDEAYMEALDGMLERVVESFDPATYVNGTKERIAALEAALGAGKVYEPAKRATAEPGIDLIAALEAFAAKKTKK